MKINFLKAHWREIISRASLPLLTLGAMYGVYKFSSSFVPWLVALVIAGAFELVYVGLAIATDLNANQRRRAKWISLGAVAVSVSYNWAAGILHVEPAMFDQLDRFAKWILAGLHGAPLAVLAYLVADLLLHSGGIETIVEKPNFGLFGRKAKQALHTALDQIANLKGQLQDLQSAKVEAEYHFNQNRDLQEIIKNGKAHNEKLLSDLQKLRLDFNELQNTKQFLLDRNAELQNRSGVSQETIQELQKLGSRLQRRELNIDGFRLEVARLLG